MSVMYGFLTVSAFLFSLSLSHVVAAGSDLTHRYVQRQENNLQGNGVPLQTYPSQQDNDVEDDDNLVFVQPIAMDERHVSDVDRFVHPTLPDRSVWLWQYQFLFLIVAMVVMYGIEIIIDFAARKKLSPFARLRTCIMLGANIRPTKHFKVLHLARFFTCVFIHSHVFHLISNVVCITAAWTYFTSSPVSLPKGVWVYHWTVPLFMIPALFGSVYSYFTTLTYAGASIGASGGALGLTSAFVTLAVFVEGIPPYKRFNFAAVILLIVISCIPWDYVCNEDSGQPVDWASHVGGATVAILLSCCLGSLHVSDPTHFRERLVLAGDILTLILLVLLLLAYIEVAREYWVKGNALFIEAFSKCLNFDDTLPEGARRYTTAGRICSDVLTEEEFEALLQGTNLDDPEVLREVLEHEAAQRRKTCPTFLPEKSRIAT